MKKLTITLIVLLALTMCMASCSHESPVPFLEEMGISTDSLLVDSFPSAFDYETQGTAVTEEQCESLGLHKGQYKIVSVRNFKGNYLIFYCEGLNFLCSVLYNKDGKVLDRCNGLGAITPIKNQDFKDMPVWYTENDSLAPHDFVWQYKFVSNEGLEVVGIRQTDTLKYDYIIADNKIKQIKRTANVDLYTPSIDIGSLPTSQADNACEIAKNTISAKDFVSDHENLCCCGIIGHFNNNIQSVLHWVACHRNENERIINTLRFYYRAPEYLNKLKGQILQIKDKEAQQYLLKVLIGE